MPLPLLLLPCQWLQCRMQQQQHRLQLRRWRRSTLALLVGPPSALRRRIEAEAGVDRGRPPDPDRDPLPQDEAPGGGPPPLHAAAALHLRVAADTRDLEAPRSTLEETAEETVMVDVTGTMSVRVTATVSVTATAETGTGGVEEEIGGTGIAGNVKIDD
mmetsp:Transcript_16907/g.20388  ORF Transcript_16907/g.20388 Transcript_16907/m.20388 type:complete len:159 (+) Transcript_16907:434-910(+)